VAQQIVEDGLSGHALGDCLGILVDQMWRSDGALLRIVEELQGMPNGAQLNATFMSMGAELLDRLPQVAQAEDRAFGEDADRGEAGCFATRLYWRMIEEDTLAFEGDLADVEMRPGAGCLEQMGVLMPRARIP
jgi:hypothetical protein